MNRKKELCSQISHLNRDFCNYLSVQEVVLISKNLNDDRLDVSIARPQGGFVLHVVDGQHCVQLVFKVDDRVLDLGRVVAVVAAQAQVQHRTGGRVENLSVFTKLNHRTAIVNYLI